MMSEKKVPAIRFRGFEDDWEQRKLSNITDIVGGGTPSTSNPDYWEGDIDWYTPAEIGEQICAYGSVRKITKEGLIHSSAKILPAHKTVLFTSRAGIGNMAILKRPAATNQGFQSLVCHDDIDPYFMFSMGDSIKAKAERVAAGSTFAEISGKKLGELEFMFPDTDEQKAIGAYFKNLDYLITLHQRKLEKLKIVKKSMLVNCFPKNGEKVPKFRFSGFTGDWEQRKVGDITIESTEYTTLDAGYPLLTSSRAGLMYQNEYRGNLTTDSKETLFSVVPIGACTYRHMSDDDVFHLNINTLEKGLVSREYPVFFATKENCLNFIIQYINSSASFRAFCAEQKKGGTRTRLYYNALCEFKMMVPSKREQEVIAGYLLSLDHLITLHQKQWFILKKLQFSPGSNSPVAA